MKLDSDSDVFPPPDVEKSGFQSTSIARKSHETTDTTHFDVPLTFASGSVPGTPKTVDDVPVETSRMYVGLPPRPSAIEYNRPPRSDTREMRQLYPAANTPQAPPSPKFPMQGNGNIPSGWQSQPAQRSQQNIPTIQVQSVDGQSRAMRNESPQPNRNQPQPGRNEQGQYQQSRDQPQQRRNEQPRSEQSQYQSSRNQVEPQPFRSTPESPRNQRFPVVGPVPQAAENQPRSIRNEQQTPPTRIPAPTGQSQSTRNQGQNGSAPTPPTRKEVPQAEAVPARGPPAQTQPAQVNQASSQLAQPESTIPRQNSRKGLIPPFPVDAATRKPIANRSPTPEAPVVQHRSSSSDVSLSSDETPPPTKITPIISTPVPSPRSPEIQRDPSVKSVIGQIEIVRSVSPPPTPKVVSPPKANVTKPTPPKVAIPPMSPMGTGFVGKEQSAPSIPPVSVAPPTPRTAQFPRETTPPVIKSPSKEEISSGSVTADILRLSVAETEANSRHTSMVVESHSRVNSTIEETPPSRVASSAFEMEYTSPLVISKVDEPENSKGNAIEDIEETEEVDRDSLLFSLPPTLPALERGSLFSLKLE